MDPGQLLVRYGFITPQAREKYALNPKTKEYEPLPGYTLDAKDADQEEKEIAFRTHGMTEFPRPWKTYRLSWEVYDLSLEEPYFWVLEYLRQQYQIIDKVEDSFAAAENSAFFGVTQQRLGAQQDKISQFLATTGKMIKELFQMVRELRIIDERLTYYEEAYAQLSKPMTERSKAAEITLKGFFVDLVQGGGKSAASVYGMARELEFITLPDLFFDTPPFKTAEEMDVYVEGLKVNFNQNVIRVLHRHLRQFMEWKHRTHQEHKNRRRFQLAYLKQHFDIIQMYLNWVKPYLRHVQRLSMKEKNLALPEIVSAFEGSMLDIELLAQKPSKGGFDCLLVTFHYRTRPEMKVVQEGYQRGPVHIGRFEMQFRVYGWLKEEVENYKRMKEKEALELIGDVSASVQEAMVSLGKELSWYLEEAQGRKHSHEDTPAAAPLRNSWKERWLGDFYHARKPTSSGPSRKDQKVKEQEKAAFKKMKPGHSMFHAWNGYHTFKKAHRMIAW